jgi:long-chain acyl-CoA synthetase
MGLPALGAPDPERGEDRVAFVVPRPGAMVSKLVPDELYLANIARFKRPKRYFLSSDLPKNSYGKVLKGALRGNLKEIGE